MMNNLSDEEKELYQTIGLVVVRWGLIEQSVDFCIAVIFHSCGGKNIRKELPVSLTQKNEFLKRAFTTIDVLAPYRKHGLSLLHRVVSMASIRDNLVHSAANSLSAENGTFQFHHVKIEPQIHRFLMVTLHTKKFPKLAKSLMDLAIDMANFARELVLQFGSKK